MERLAPGWAVGRALEACVVVALGLLPGDAQALDLLQDDHTSVEVEGYLPGRTTSPSSPYVSVGSEVNEGGPTSFEFTANAPAGWSPAELHGTGSASFGSLGATLSLSGPAARQASVYANFHDVFTVATPQSVEPGSPGTMSFVYRLDGLADATGQSGETADDEFSIAVVQISMRKWFSNGQDPPSPTSELLGSESFEVVSSNSLEGGVVNAVNFAFAHWAVIDVPFEYGVPIALRVSFRIAAFTDNDHLGTATNPYREFWGGGVFESVIIDASNTARLVAIVNQVFPEAPVTGVSVDYSPLVTDVAPAPEPSGQLLAAAAVTVLAALARSRSRRGSQND